MYILQETHSTLMSSLVLREQSLLGSERENLIQDVLRGVEDINNFLRSPNELNLTKPGRKYTVRPRRGLDPNKEMIGNEQQRRVTTRTSGETIPCVLKPRETS